MFYKKFILFCLLLSCVCMCPGCESAPETYREDMQKNHVELDTEKFVSLETAQEQCEKLEGQDVDGMVFPEKMIMPGQNTVAEVKLTPWYEGNRKALQQILQSVWKDYDTVDWTGIKKQVFSRKDDEKYRGESKEDKKTGILYSFDTQGFVCGDSLKDTELTCQNCVKEYDGEPGTDLESEDTYQLEDGEVSVKEAVLYTENLFNNSLSQWEEDKFEYKVQHLYVMKNPENAFYDYNMVIGRVYQNRMVDTCSDFLVSQAAYYDQVHSGIHILAIMRHKNSLDYVNLGNELLEVESEIKHNTIISPMWAVQKMNEEIAHVNGMAFSPCGLVYVLVQDNELAKKKKQDIFQSVNQNTYLRPVWLFATPCRNSMYETMTNDGHGVSVLVDALDGELYYYEGTGAY